MQAKPEIIWLSEVDSTNRYAMNNFAALTDGTLIAAEFQTAGKGRQDRTWISPRGENIYASFVMKNLAPPVCNASIIASLGAVQMLRQAAPGVKFWIKWPNDICCGLKKIAGVLCESKLSAASSGMVAGIGININMPQAALDVIDQPATSLAAETGRNSDLQSTVTALAEELRRLYADYSTAPRQVFELWKQENLLIGKTVEIVDAGQRLLQGRITDIGESGEIIFETGGRTLKFYSGDIRIRKESLDGSALFSSRELKK